MNDTTSPAHPSPTVPGPIPARDPRDEAQRLVAGRFEARVLEPSPPAVDDPPWFADDPTDPSGGTQPVVGPTSAADLTWDRWVRDYPDQAAWAADRWLGAYRRLGPVPAAFDATRVALHRLAVYVLSPSRRQVNGKIALRWTHGGFGTPFFGDDAQVRVAGTDLVRQVGATARVAPITSLRAAAEFALGGEPDLAWAAEFDVPDAGDLDARLPVDAKAAQWLADWYGFGCSVLEEVRSESASVDASRVQLWVEHFDCAFECLPEAEGRRAGYGFSPGDAGIPEPYVYVVPWTFDRVPGSARWNAEGFNGAILRFSEFVDAPDQRGAALAFLRECRALLAS